MLPSVMYNIHDDLLRRHFRQEPKGTIEWQVTSLFCCNFLSMCLDSRKSNFSKGELANKE